MSIQSKYKYFGLSLSLLCIYGCNPSPILPQHQTELAEYITEPEREEKVEVTEEVDTKTENEKILEKEIPTLPDWFTDKRFPSKCTWKELIRVVDGDTVLIKPDNRIRFVGVDTPETKHPDKPIEPGGLEASAFTKEVLKDAKKICLIRDRIGDPYDHYGRILGYIYTEDGRDLNAELVLRGYGVAMEGFIYERRIDFLEYEKYAQSIRAGIWADRLK